jgi:hypothetical protein
MGESIGRTYGYGRVSTRLEPSPYSPLHRPSQMPGSAPATLPAGAVRRRGGRVATLAVVVVVAVFAGILLTFAARGPTPHVAVRGADVSSPPALSEEAARLPRSAIAVSKYPKPRS